MIIPGPTISKVDCPNCKYLLTYVDPNETVEDFYYCDCHQWASDANSGLLYREQIIVRLSQTPLASGSIRVHDSYLWKYILRLYPGYLPSVLQALQVGYINKCDVDSILMLVRIGTSES